jgi:hypothetical protein
MARVLRAFHHHCMRSMCRLNLWHTRHNHVKTSTLATRLGIQTIETCIARRQMRWLGHVWRIPETRLPKQLLTAWLPQKRPVGRPELTYGQTVVRTVRAVEAHGELPSLSWLCTCYSQCYCCYVHRLCCNCCCY